MEKGAVVTFGTKTAEDAPFYQLLEREGYNLIHSASLAKAHEIVFLEDPVAVLVDLDNFGDEAWKFCAEMKDELIGRRTAVILLSSSDDEGLKVRGLDLGADDFVTKPFGAAEMVARIRAISRRIARANSKKIRVKDLEIDLDEHRVRKSGKPIDLTYIQFKLLYLLASRRMNVFSRKEILERVWGKKVYVTNRTVDVHIKRLREKLGEYKYPSQYIETIHGTGYRFL
jgi:DNA-binding response OmpR family regulator